MHLKSILLAGAALLAVPTIVEAQPAPLATQEARGDEGEDSPEILVAGERTGAALGAIPPETILTRADLKATGATDIDGLIKALAPQIGSARGRDSDPAILLLNGQRISSFRELRDIPTDAISRMEILPEAASLTYGHRADQRVINVVLKAQFRTTAGAIQGSAATGGGYASGMADVTRLLIDGDRRTTINLRAEGNSALTENERAIFTGRPIERDGTATLAARSLVGAKLDLRGAFTHYRRIGSVGVTGNVELGHREERALIGLGETILAPLARTMATDSVHAGLALNGNAARWYWSVTGNADASREVIDTDRDAQDIRDRAVTGILSGDIDALANGALFRVPAGEAGATIRIGARRLHLDSDRRRSGVRTANTLGRTGGDASLSFDLPVSWRGSGFAPLGNLVLNGNVRGERLSDTGFLTTIGAGLYWSPVPRLDLTASWTREEGAPTVRQLGEPVIETPGTRLFDFTTGQTVLVTAITGGNPGLDADRRNVMAFGMNWKPFEDANVRLRADYVRSRLSGPVSSLPGPTAALEAAFPERFVRNQAGALISVDLRPINFESARRDTLRLGFDFPIRLGAAPRPKEPAMPMEVMTSGPVSPASGGQPVRTLFSPSDDGRLWLSLTDTITLRDAMTMRGGLKLDYLRGDAVGQAGGRPRHDIEGRAGYYRNGYGTYLSANWRSGTHVTTATGRDLRFSPLATFDLRLFANLDQNPALVSKHPWLEGVSIHLEVTNLFNARPTVRDAFGDVPPGFPRDLLDPIGRMIRITLRIGGGGFGG